MKKPPKIQKKFLKHFLKEWRKTLIWVQGDQFHIHIAGGIIYIAMYHVKTWKQAKLNISYFFSL